MDMKTVHASGRAPLPDSLRHVLGSYESIALVANSEDVDLEALKESLPEATLFVFFTRCPRILKQPFDRPSILCHRLKRDGSFNEGSKHVAAARGRFKEDALLGEIAIHVGTMGSDDDLMLSVAADTNELAREDLSSLFEDFYTVGMTPTTGFALAVWLEAQDLKSDIVLCGFTGVRGGKFRMRIMHDWTLEQTTLRLLEYRKRLSFQEYPEGRDIPLLRMRNRFGDVPVEISAFVAVDVLSDRLTGLDRMISRLWQVTRAQRRIHEAVGRMDLERFLFWKKRP